MRKKWAYIPFDQARADSIQQELTISPVLAMLLAQRGMSSPPKARQFLHPEMSQVHDPSQLKDINKAISRLQKAIQQKETILLHGDYDVDGTTCVAMVFSFLSSLTNTDRIKYFIPNRYQDGYGFTRAGLDYAIEKKVNLIITLDCGIRAVAMVDQAKQIGIDCIICDHHLVGDQTPKAVAILNPKQPDCHYPYKQLSACGVAYQFLQAYAQQYEIDQAQVTSLLDFVALSIASDVVDMTGENRVLAHYGLEQLNRNPRAGLLALIEKSSRTLPLKISDLVYGLGPMINAAGRLADAELAVKLLLASDKTNAYKLADFLDRRNEIRKKEDRLTLDEAIKLIESDPTSLTQKAFVLYKPNWHKGIVGIVAARLAEKYHRPVILLTRFQETISGSGRSIPGFDLSKAVNHCKEHLVTYGGHRQAVGLTMNADRYESFKDSFLAYASVHEQQAESNPTIAVSAILLPEEIDESLLEEINQLAPFGPKNRRPVFVSEELSLAHPHKILKEKHLKLSIQTHDGTLAAIGFNLADQVKQIDFNNFAICYTIEGNQWRGQTTIQLNIKDIK